MITVLACLSALPILAIGLAEAWRNSRVLREVDRAVREWPELVQMIESHEPGDPQPTELLQERGYRSYEVRRRILLCLIGPAASDARTRQVVLPP